MHNNAKAASFRKAILKLTYGLGIAALGSGLVYAVTRAAVPATPTQPELAFHEDFSGMSWTTLADMPFSTADETVAAVDNKFYIIGGYNNTAADPLNTNYQFDPLTNAYTQKAAMPTKRWGPIAMPINNLIYVFGGQFVGGSAANEVYNPATNTWQVKANLPAAIAAQGITGCSDGTNAFLFYNGQSYRYNVAQNTYTQLPNAPQHITSWGSCSYVDGKIYLIGGYNNGGQPHTQIYSLATNTWTLGAPMPFGTYGSIRENPVIGTDIYIVQGQRRDGEFSSKVYKYSTTANIWTEKSFGPHAADGVAGAIYDGKIYTFGGRQDVTGPYGLPYASAYDPSLDASESQWRQITGNFEVANGQLRKMVPRQGNLYAGMTPQIQTTNYQLPASFTLEAQSNQTTAGGSWNALGISTNAGSYNSSLSGYLMPYNDYGVSPMVTAAYRESGASYTKLGALPVATGPQRFKIVSAADSVKLYRNHALVFTTTDATHRGGYLNVIAGTNQSTWDFILVRP